MNGQQLPGLQSERCVGAAVIVAKLYFEDARAEFLDNRANRTKPRAGMSSSKATTANGLSSI
jgi:hypothetical protein